MQSRQAEVRAIIQNIEKNIFIPNQISYQVALYGEDERSLAIFDMSHAEELFAEGVLSLDHLHNTKTLNELTATLDNYISIIDFYHKNHFHFHDIITSPIFCSLVEKKGDLACWNELMLHSFSKLNLSQIKVLVIDSLTRLPELTEFQDEKLKFSRY